VAEARCETPARQVGFDNGGEASNKQWGLMGIASTFARWASAGKSPHSSYVLRINIRILKIGCLG
jgi:hypothetical protein